MTRAPAPRWQRWFDRQALVAQLGWLALVVGVALACLGQLLGPWLLARLGALAVPVTALAVLLLGGAVAAWWTGRIVRALQSVDEAAQVLRSDHAPLDGQFPLEDSSAEMRAASVSLRRTVEVWRQRMQALTARNASLGNQLQTRTHELSTLQDLSIGLASHSELNDLVDDALGALEKTVAYTSASIWAREGLDPDGDVVLMGYRTSDDTELPPDSAGVSLAGQRLSRSNLQRYHQIEQAAAPVIENDVRQSFFSWLWALVVDDARSSALYRATRSWMAVPLRFHEEVLGVMRIDHVEPGFFDTERARLLAAVGSQAALAMRHTQLQAQGRELAVLNERHRIARDLHDAVSQTLFAAQMLAGSLLQMLRRPVPPDNAAVISQVQSLERLNRAALAEMRLLMFELRPDALENMPLADLLQNTIDTMTTRGDLVVEKSLARDVGFPPALRLHLYRMAQEALSNLVRHSGATRALVEWKVHSPDTAELRILDNGIGFQPDVDRPGHFGLGNMRSRAAEIGARLTIESRPGLGTDVLIQLGMP